MPSSFIYSFSIRSPVAVHILFLSNSSIGSSLYTALTSRYPTSLSALSIPLSLPIYIQSCMLIILLVLSRCQKPIRSLFRLFAPYARSFSVAAPKICNSLPPALRMCTAAPTPFVVISRLTISSRPSNPLNAFLLAPQIRILLTIVHVYKL